MGDRTLIVDDDAGLRESLEILLSAEGYEVQSAANASLALARCEQSAPEIVLCDARMPGSDGQELLPQLHRLVPRATLILMSAQGSTQLAALAVSRGVYDYLSKPIQPSEALLVMRNARERERMRRRTTLLRRDIERAVGQRPIVASSERMIELLELMERAAAYKTPVLVTGERGTGKEVLARAIHAQSPRRHEAFVAVSCAAIPQSRLEAELFGRSGGASSGSDRAQRGLFEQANGGTLFLDEVGALPATLQPKLLRALQEEEIHPIGDSKAHSVDVRVISASSQRLEQEVAAGRFREDLLHRLSVVQLEVPPLRERPKDVSLLVDHHLAQFCDLLGKPLRGVTDEALERLVGYAWPGNVRELQNLIERAVLLADGEWITLQELPPTLAGAATGTRSRAPELSLRRARRTAERDAIRRALQETGGNRTHAARLLEISHRALLYKLKEYVIRD